MEGEVEKDKDQEQGHGDGDEEALAGAAQVLVLSAVGHGVTSGQVIVLIHQGLDIGHHRFHVAVADVDAHDDVAAGHIA